MIDLFFFIIIISAVSTSKWKQISNEYLKLHAKVRHFSKIAKWHEQWRQAKHQPRYQCNVMWCLEHSAWMCWEILTLQVLIRSYLRARSYPHLFDELKINPVLSFLAGSARFWAWSIAYLHNKKTHLFNKWGMVTTPMIYVHAIILATQFYCKFYLFCFVAHLK